MSWRDNRLISSSEESEGDDRRLIGYFDFGLSSESEFTVEFGPVPPQRRSTPVDQEELRNLEEQVGLLLQSFLPLFPPRLIRMSDTDQQQNVDDVVEEQNNEENGGGGGGGDEAVADLDAMTPQELVRTIKQMGINQININKQLESTIKVVNGLAKDNNERGKVLDVFFSHFEDYAKSQKEELSALKEIHGRMDKRETDRHAKEMEFNLKIKSNTFPDIPIDPKKSLPVEVFFSYGIRVEAIIRSNNYNVEDRVPRSRVIDAILAGLSEKAMAKTTTIRPNAAGLYEYDSISSFLKALRTCLCGEGIASTAAASFAARQQRKNEDLTVYMSACYNLWEIAYDLENRSWQILCEHVVNYLWSENFRFHLKAVEIPIRRARGELTFTRKGWEELKVCLLEVQANLKEARSSYTHTTVSYQPRNPNTSYGEAMDTNYVGNSSHSTSSNSSGQKPGSPKKNNYRQPANGQQNANNRSKNGNSDKQQQNRNPPAGAQARYKRAAAEAEKKIKEHRRLNNLCFICGGDHLARDCSQKPKQKPPNNSVSATAAAPEKEAPCAMIGDTWWAPTDDLSHGGVATVMPPVCDYFEEWADPWFPEEEAECSSVHHIDSQHTQHTVDRRSRRLLPGSTSPRSSRRKEQSWGNEKSLDFPHLKSGQSTM